MTELGRNDATVKQQSPGGDLPGPVAGAAAVASDMLERLAARLGARATVQTIYGEAVQAQGVTVIPVARVAYGFGGGTGRAAGGDRQGDGGGAGGGVEARPVGFIQITDGRATYTPIRTPWTELVVPVTGMLLGAAVPKIVRALSRRRR
jgi:uncharacterized spore protein YtfJ